MTSRFAIVDYPRGLSGRCGELVSFSITVKNIGNSVGKVHVEVRDRDNRLLCKSFRVVLAPGDVYTFSPSICLMRLGNNRSNYYFLAINDSEKRIDDRKSIYVNVQGNGRYGLVFKSVGARQLGRHVVIDVDVSGVDCCTVGEIDVANENGIVVARRIIANPICYGETARYSIVLHHVAPGDRRLEVLAVCYDCNGKVTDKRDVEIRVLPMSYEYHGGSGIGGIVVLAPLLLLLLRRGV